MENVDELLRRAKSGEKRAVSKLISIVERGGGEASGIEATLRGDIGGGRVIGITAPPGAGKSTLISALIKLLRQRGISVGVIAVDPTSPFTGGAILGDRVRMPGEPDAGLFIRSMGSRGALGGLSAATRSAVNVLDACGYEVIIIETVGVGQSEIDVVNNADMVLLLAVPGQGDDIQGLKAGLLEIGDIFVVNKCDLPGADRVSAELRSSLSLAPDERSREVPVLMTSALTGEGLPELIEAMDARYEILKNSGEIAVRRALRTGKGDRSKLIETGGKTGLNCMNIDHIGIAVESLEQAAEFYENVLGIKRAGVEEVTDQQVKVMFLPCGDCEVELLESTAGGSPVERFIAKNGAGVQHIAIRVENIEAALAELKEKNIRLIDETPRYGAGGAKVAFVHPKSTNGVLLELCER